jgi:hypothetical protein
MTIGDDCDALSTASSAVRAACAASIVRGPAKRMISEAKIKPEQLRPAMARTVGIG